MTLVADLHKQWMQDEQYRKAYDALEPEFALAQAVIEARAAADLTQRQLAQRMETTQSVIARLEGGRARPSTQTLERLAAATGTRLRISFEPIEQKTIRAQPARRVLQSGKQRNRAKLPTTTKAHQGKRP